MQKQFSIKLRPDEAADEQVVKKYIAVAEGINPGSVRGYHPLRRSIDARGRQIWINLTLLGFINEPFVEREKSSFHFHDVNQATRQVIIVGGGPTGLFAALHLLESGIRPVIIERGRDVRARRRDLAQLNKEGIINPDSNYCFGEGGAGTYSDGKLYTRSNKRGDINRILNLFVHFGADEKILFESHPHIGTNKLPQIISNMRKQVEDCGGLFLFNKKLTGFTLEKDHITTVSTADGDRLHGEAVILATGHSARDIFILLHEKKILVEAKPFALGVRAEHPQALIDAAQYHCDARGPYLPPASYTLVQQVKEKGVFSFCMCPGGIIAPAATSAGELVVNGWSPSKRNNPFANSGIVVQIEDEMIATVKDVEKIVDPPKDAMSGPLRMMYFQQYVEKKSFNAGGGRFVAPAQRLVDFCDKKISSSLPACSYLPGIHSHSLDEVLPGFVHARLREAFKEFGKKMKGYYTNEAVLVAVESRTSSPVRIPRDAISLHHPQVKNLYPAGEGAGYAGGIMSAAMDGERIAAQIAITTTG
jgi:uncharacterized FAD-dependent dehydrogenase